MKIAKIKHYAKSLIEIGQGHNCFEEIVDQLKNVEEKLAENPDFKKYLLNKRVGFIKKREALEHVFQDFLSKRTYNFLYLLIKNNKLVNLSDILNETNKVNLKNNKIKEVLVESVIPLPSEIEKTIKKIIEKKINSEIILRNIINQALLGGMKITIGDTVIDGSLFGKISRLQRKMENYE
ncbi:ATP synthase F1 subunit delta [Candidatus Kuenenbacteria bacterium]|nr:ATP synthase F1 subunit delta [Candidatus Kuenenbacteria bacterium]